jgi:hypothetical protein
VDEGLEAMTREQLVAEARRLRAGIPAEGRQAGRVLAERDHDRALEEDRRADGDDDQVQDVGAARGVDGEALEQDADRRDGEHGEHDHHRQRQAGRAEQGRLTVSNIGR